MSPLLDRGSGLCRKLGKEGGQGVHYDAAEASVAPSDLKSASLLPFLNPGEGVVLKFGELVELYGLRPVRKAPRGLGSGQDSNRLDRGDEGKHEARRDHGVGDQVGVTGSIHGGVSGLDGNEV